MRSAKIRIENGIQVLEYDSLNHTTVISLQNGVDTSLNKISVHDAHLSNFIADLRRIKRWASDIKDNEKIKDDSIEHGQNIVGSNVHIRHKCDSDEI